MKNVLKILQKYSKNKNHDTNFETQHIYYAVFDSVNTLSRVFHDHKPCMASRKIESNRLILSYNKSTFFLKIKSDRNVTKKVQNSDRKSYNRKIYLFLDTLHLMCGLDSGDTWLSVFFHRNQLGTAYKADSV